MDPFVGQLALFPYNFAPLNWAQCAGQIIPISQNTALFSLLGTRFGGNGTSTFGLPDLRGRVPLGAGTGASGANYALGQIGGMESVQLNASHVPGHDHAFPASTVIATQQDPQNAVIAQGPNQGGRGEDLYPNYYTAEAGTRIPLPAAICSFAGGGDGHAHNNLQPFLSLTWCIALYGVFPSRP